MFKKGDVAYDSSGLGYVEVEDVTIEHYHVKQVTYPYKFDRIRIVEEGVALIRPWWGVTGRETFWGRGD